MGEDASRRDFTVNALYTRLTDGEVLDPLGGLEDLPQCLLRTTRNSDDVFSEDALRLLRLARFACELGFSVEKDTWEGACRQVSGLANIVPSRVGQELSRILLSDRRQIHAGGEAVRQGLSLLRDMGAFLYMLPELMDEDALNRGIDAATRAADRFSLRLAALCSSIDPAAAAGMCLRLDLGKNLAQRVRTLLETPDEFTNDDELCLCLAELGEEMAKEYIELKYACGKTNLARRAERILKNMLRDKVPFAPEGIALNGREIAAIMGGKPGPRIGKMKRALWISVIKRETANEPSALGHKIKQLTAHPELWDEAENKEET